MALAAKTESATETLGERAAHDGTEPGADGRGDPRGRSAQPLRGYDRMGDERATVGVSAVTPTALQHARNAISGPPLGRHRARRDAPS